MGQKRQIFLLGTVAGILIGVLLFVLIYLLFYLGNNISFKKIAYNVDVDSAVNQAIEKASPSVVGIVRIINEKESGTGSGVIYKITNKYAYIVTNHHVVKDAEKIEVAFQNELRREAKLIGDDLISDLAVIRIPKGNITDYMEFSDSDNLHVGEFVFAIGNPLGLNFYGSATLGIVSSKERLIPIDVDKDGESDWFAHVIQTDAAINPGNSGGALVNVAGKLVGINSMKIAGSQVEGIGFSIPTKIVLKVINDIENYGEVIRPFIGIHLFSVNKLTAENKSEIGLEYLTNGVYVNDVVPDSSAKRAGIKINDVITKIDGTVIKDVSDFRYQVYQKALGDVIKITIIRNNKALDLNLVLQKK